MLHVIKRKMKKIIEQLKSAKLLLETFYETKANIIETDLLKIEDLTRLADKISPHWIGAWTPDKTDIYNNFISQSQEPTRLTYEQIKKWAESLTQHNLDEIRERVRSTMFEVRDLNQNVLTELSIIKGEEGLEDQIQLLAKLNDFTFGVEESEIIQSQRPNQLMGNYNQIHKMMTEGLDNPPHLIYASQVVAPGSKLVSIQEYRKLVIRLIRELEIKVGGEKLIKSFDAITLLENLITKFHLVAVQLKNRHSARETIVINDEYDVQDLFHALLKIHFDDIRPEEYSPSYAGKNTRIDFLLKNERIMVEVKKTRENLKDSKIGSELILDIARYKNHPDCDTLYCFVYDPQSLISNPRGLEGDLKTQSNEDLDVHVKIVP